MDLSKISIFSMMRQNMDYLSQRQDVISENIANANVPDYQPKDIKRPEFQDFMTSYAPKPSLFTTSSKHIAGIANANNVTGRVEKAKFSETSLNGNKVSLEEETLKMSKNAAEYQQTTSIYRKMVQLLKMALGEQV